MDDGEEDPVPLRSSCVVPRVPQTPRSTTHLLLRLDGLCSDDCFKAVAPPPLGSVANVPPMPSGGAALLQSTRAREGFKREVAGLKMDVVIILPCTSAAFVTPAFSRRQAAD